MGMRTVTQSRMGGGASHNVEWAAHRHTTVKGRTHITTQVECLQCDATEAERLHEAKRLHEATR
jgi:hypothetical protein